MKKIKNRIFMKRVYLIPNIVTAFGLACGLFVIFKVNMIIPSQSDYHVMLVSALLLLLAGLADFIDGVIARYFKVESDYGLIFDSIADAISFGVAPTILILKGLTLTHGSIISFFCSAGAMVYSICGVLRLVRFSIKSVESKGNILEMSAMKKNFTGLPIPAAAAAGISVILLLLSPYSQYLGDLSNDVIAIIMFFVMVFLGYLMLSKWKFPSLKGLHFRVQSFHLAFLSVIFAIFLLYGILYYFPVLLFIISWAYILLAVILSIIRLIAGKKSKTLTDYEPANDEDE
jgi:CDP-diacylglycerol---serine O-phosphatidyltransferase